jgi:hypothetical protein
MVNSLMVRSGTSRPMREVRLFPSFLFAVLGDRFPCQVH